LFESRWPLLLAHPFYAVAADLRMFALAVTGRLRAELARNGVYEESNGFADAGRGSVVSRLGGRLATWIGARLLVGTAVVLAIQCLIWFREGIWPSFPIDATLRHWGITLTDTGIVETRWTDRIDENVLSFPVSALLLSGAIAALAFARWVKARVPRG